MLQVDATLADLNWIYGSCDSRKVHDEESSSGEKERLKSIAGRN